MLNPWSLLSSSKALHPFFCYISRAHLRGSVKCWEELKPMLVIVSDQSCMHDVTLQSDNTATIRTEWRSHLPAFNKLYIFYLSLERVVNKVAHVSCSVLVGNMICFLSVLSEFRASSYNWHVNTVSLFSSDSVLYSVFNRKNYICCSQTDVLCVKYFHRPSMLCRLNQQLLLINLD